MRGKFVHNKKHQGNALPGFYYLLKPKKKIKLKNTKKELNKHAN